MKSYSQTCRQEDQDLSLFLYFNCIHVLNRSCFPCRVWRDAFTAGTIIFYTHRQHLHHEHSWYWHGENIYGWKRWMPVWTSVSGNVWTSHVILDNVELFVGLSGWERRVFQDSVSHLYAVIVFDQCRSACKCMQFWSLTSSIEIHWHNTLQRSLFAIFNIRLR